MRPDPDGFERIEPRRQHCCKDKTPWLLTARRDARAAAPGPWHCPVSRHGPARSPGKVLRRPAGPFHVKMAKPGCPNPGMCRPFPGCLPGVGCVWGNGPAAALLFQRAGAGCPEKFRASQAPATCCRAPSPARNIPGLMDPCSDLHTVGPGRFRFVWPRSFLHCLSNILIGSAFASLRKKQNPSAGIRITE